MAAKRGYMQCSPCKTKGPVKSWSDARAQTDTHNQVKHGSKAPTSGARTMGA